MAAPRATYRLQLGPGLGFAAVRELVPYLERLGVADVYLSPVARARSGSTHFYDVVDPSVLDPALGTEDELGAMAEACRAAGMGVLLDVVPNHMAADEENRWWWDVLAHGPESAYAGFFDIDWSRGPIVLPVVAEPTEEARAEAARRFPASPHYELAWWREGRTRLNYRRFFEIDDLVGVRVECDEVFDTVHALTARLVERGWVTSLRVDHVDGLRDPEAYLSRLRSRLGVPVVVEKILAPSEELPEAWPVEGTTGYEFAAAASRLLVDPAGVRALRAVYAAYTGDGRTFGEVAREQKERVLVELFPAELDRLSSLMPREAVVRLTADLPFYRTYAPGPDWVLRWQQLTGAVAAKGVEDTALYRHGALVSLNEVGGDPDVLWDDPVASFHAWCVARRARWPGSLNATTTHDTKRSEDVRNRIHVLSELPREWAAALERWPRPPASEVDPSDVVLVYQTLLGAWPVEEDRLAAYLVKAAREAKGRTSWLDPDEGYESALVAFGGGLLRDDAFVRDFLVLQERVTLGGAVNSLAEVVLKVAAPGVPDVYRGTELWDLSLVDPDNRRPVDFRLRQRLLDDVDGADPAELLASWRDGRVKLWVLSSALRVRRSDPELFGRGAYVPLTARGSRASSVVAFARELDGRRAVAVVPRATASWCPPGTFPVGAVWGDTEVDGMPLADVLSALPIALVLR